MKNHTAPVQAHIYIYNLLIYIIYILQVIYMHTFYLKRRKKSRPCMVHLHVPVPAPCGCGRARPCECVRAHVIAWQCAFEFLLV